jgi:hypothetical protein
MDIINVSKAKGKAFEAILIIRKLYAIATSQGKPKAEANSPR